MERKRYQRGKASLAFENGPQILGKASVAGKKEGEGPLGEQFDIIEPDPLLGCENWEEAESALQKEAADLVIERAGLVRSEVRYLFAGDLLGQLIATSFGTVDLELPLFGLYGACSTIGEALCLGAMTVEAGYADYVMALSSSHFASAEKQFRFPLEYGNQRPLSTTWTVTGSGAFILGKKGGSVRISGITPGRIVDMGLKDSMNMGACMAPAACDTICRSLEDFEREPEDYDRIITGDLGQVGTTILLDFMKSRGHDIRRQHRDCGTMIFDAETQDTHSGGSGCGCSALVLAAEILPKLMTGQWQRVLFLPTGALLSSVSFNEGNSVPGIAHGVILEHC
ncbi:MULTISPECIES: stage V sporulation protein AD [unclassified Candidatus Paralachnospira]|uniref:stage V sporulation protein AD n=1 Tax=unclassified Candidatus Paralachnospira TaxID=3099471 RepID=UPI003F93A123